MAVLLGLDALIFVLFFCVLKKEPSRLHIRLNILAPFAIQFVSIAGWMVREIGRKPWTVYGLVKVEEAANPSALSPFVIAGIVAYLVSLIVGVGLVIVLVFGRKKTKKMEIMPEKVTEESDGENHGS